MQCWGRGAAIQECRETFENRRLSRLVPEVGETVRERLGEDCDVLFIGKLDDADAVWW